MHLRAWFRFLCDHIEGTLFENIIASLREFYSQKRPLTLLHTAGEYKRV